MNINLKKSLATASTLALGVAFALGSASSAQAVETWTITGLTLDNPVVIDAYGTAGDDGGFLAVTKKHVILDGDDAVFAYDLSTMAAFAATDVPANDEDYNIATDLKSNTAYVIQTGELSINEVDSLVALDVDGNVTSTVVTLSESIDLTSGSWILMSGFGWIGFWEYNVGAFKYVDPTTGTVTTEPGGVHVLSDYAPMPQIDAGEGTGQFDSSGVGMFDGSNFWYVGIDVNDDISKFVLTTDVEQAVMLDNTDPDVDNSDNFTISTCSNRFYNHNEDPNSDSWFGQDTTNMDEPLLSADATFSSAGDCTLPSDPELPNTGMDAGAGVALSALLAGLGAAAFIVVRRRQVASK